MGGVLIVRVTLLGQQRFQTGHTQALSPPAVLAQAVNSSPGRVVAEPPHISPTAVSVLMREKIVHPCLNQRVIFSQTEGPDLRHYEFQTEDEAIKEDEAEVLRNLSQADGPPHKTYAG